MAISPNRSPGSISATTVSRWSIGLAMAMANRPRSTTCSESAMSPSWNSTSPRMRCCSWPAAAIGASTVDAAHRRRIRYGRGGLREPCPSNGTTLAGRVAQRRLRMSGPSWSPAAAGRVSAAPSSTSRSARGGSSITPPTSPASVSDGVVVVVPPADASSEGGVAGGATRSESVRAGLAAVPAEATIVCVHDAARPFASQRAVRGGDRGGARRRRRGRAGRRGDRHDQAHRRRRRRRRHARRGRRLVAVQTPQAFRASVLRAAHARR